MSEVSISSAGSARKLEPAFVLVGLLQKAHGVKGEIEMRILTDFPKRMRPGRKLYLGNEKILYELKSARPKRDLLLLSFVGVDSREAAQRLTNSDVFVAVKELPVLPPGEYYHHQLIGLQIMNEGSPFGILREVLETGANDVYVIDDVDGNERLLPVIPSVVLSIDIDKGIIEVNVPEGL
ncbi:MAG: 16S rRNA processing protein RimM [Chloroflexi bacterium]|nr:16S rRNA processing protein RimM [Chloroflexota bacterium]